MKVLIVPNFSKPNAKDCTVQACTILQRAGAQVLLSEEFGQEISVSGIHFGAFESLLPQCDVLLAVGGDGTMIHTAKFAVAHQKPLLGVNAGRLGFLPEVERQDLSVLQKLPLGEYHREERMLLQVTHHTEQGTAQYLAINDLVVSKGALSRMVDLEVTCGQRQVSSYRADGLVLATPTGSTAYNLSVGGPILEPSMHCIALTPISPHSLVARTIVFTGEKELAIEVGMYCESEVYFTIDGETAIPLQKQDRLTVQKSSQKLQLLTLSDRAFCEVLNQKFQVRGKDVAGSEESV